MWNTKTLSFDKQGHFGCSLCIGISIIITTLFLLFIKPRINLANTVPKYLSQPAVESQKHSGPEIWSTMEINSRADALNLWPILEACDSR